MAQQNFDPKQLVIIGIVVIAIAYFVSTAALVTVSNVSTPARTMTSFTSYCFDTDGDSPGSAGAVAYLTLPSTVNANGGLGNITVFRSGLPFNNARQYDVTYQPPGITGNGVRGVITVINDLGQKTVQFIPGSPTGSSEPVTNPDAGTASSTSAILDEQVCDGQYHAIGTGSFANIWDAANDILMRNFPKKYSGSNLASGNVNIPVSPGAGTLTTRADYLV